MGWHIIHLTDVAVTPWRNGGGVTRELAVWPTQGEWTWRMSVARYEAVYRRVLASPARAAHAAATH